jgi:cbb3-type cytochrome oxidase subunit 3
MDFNHVLLWAEHRSVAVVFAVFLIVLATTYWPGRKASVEKHATIPLDDDR